MCFHNYDLGKGIQDCLLFLTRLHRKFVQVT